MSKLLSKMENERQTAGETAKIFNRFEEEIFRLNRERDARVATLLEEIHQLADERDALKLQKTEHHKAIEAINGRIMEVTGRIKQCNAETEAIRLECKRAKAKVVEEANEHYAQFPSENWLWKKVYRFFKKNPDVCLQVMKEEGGEQ